MGNDDAKPDGPPPSDAAEAELWSVACECGWKFTGALPRLVEAVQAHAREEHGEEMGADEIRAAARPLGASPQKQAP